LASICLYIQCIPKNETRVIFNTVVNLLHSNLPRGILMALAIERIHNLPHHLSYVSALPDITQKNEKVTDQRLAATFKKSDES